MMKEISHELGRELHDMLNNAQLQSELAFKAAKAGDTTNAARHSVAAREFTLRAMIHLDRHMEVDLDCWQQAEQASE